LPIKIAVLDTGVDLKHPAIMTAIQMKQIQKCMKSFVKNDESMKDECGHGTHIASLLADIAPQAQMYIAKISNSDTIPPDHQIAQVSTYLVRACINVTILTEVGFRQ
jgi:subtilisin family serine protease